MVVMIFTITGEVSENLIFLYPHQYLILLDFKISAYLMGKKK